LRIPRSSPEALRIEHRFAGADANPYLVLAVVLGGILHGLQHHLCAPPPISGNAYAHLANESERPIPRDWQTALQHLHDSQRLASLFGEPFIHLFETLKRHELQVMQNTYHPLEYAWYFERG
jgi:glutamine synthetase